MSRVSLGLKYLRINRKKPESLRAFCRKYIGLLDRYFGAADSLAAKQTHFADLVAHNAVFCSVDSEVAADLGANAGALGHANLAYDHLADFYNLATENLYTKTLAGTVVNIFGGTASFDV